VTIVDASVVIRMLRTRAFDQRLRKRLAPPRRLHAPTLIDAEVLSAIRGLLIGGKITTIAALDMMRAFAQLRIVRHPAIPYLLRAMELCHNFTFYDALYVALAEKLRMPLLTRDARISRASGHKADVHVYP
jgi:predicted nucleic acid-binding protein